MTHLLFKLKRYIFAKGIIRITNKAYYGNYINHLPIGITLLLPNDLSMKIKHIRYLSLKYWKITGIIRILSKEIIIQILINKKITIILEMNLMLSKPFIISVYYYNINDTYKIKLNVHHVSNTSYPFNDIIKLDMKNMDLIYFKYMVHIRYLKLGEELNYDYKYYLIKVPRPGYRTFIAFTFAHVYLQKKEVKKFYLSTLQRTNKYYIKQSN